MIIIKILITCYYDNKRIRRLRLSEGTARAQVGTYHNEGHVSNEVVLVAKLVFQVLTHRHRCNSRAQIHQFTHICNQPHTSVSCPPLDTHLGSLPASPGGICIGNPAVSQDPWTLATIRQMRSIIRLDSGTAVCTLSYGVLGQSRLISKK
jgi:hypothetical protein